MTLGISLNRTSLVPLHKQMEQQLKDSILAGRLTPDTPLPSTYELSDYLSISRSTAVKCYGRLLEQGYIYAVRGSGTFISKLSHANQKIDFSANDDSQPSIVLSKFASSIMEGPSAQETSWTLVPADLLPLKQWKNCTASSFQFMAGELDAGRELTIDSTRLKILIASFLGRFRGIKCGAENIAIFSDRNEALNSLIPLILNPGERVLFSGSVPREVPKYQQSIGFSPCATSRKTALDENEIVESLARLVYVSGADFGSSSPGDEDRKHSLLHFIAHHRTALIEDDSENFFTYGRPWTPSIKSLCGSESVVYITSFSQIMNPLSDLTVAVLPLELAEIFNKSSAGYSRRSTLVEQLTLAQIIDNGTFEQHIRKLHRIYTRRRQMLIFSLTTCFKSAIKVGKETFGTSISVSFHFPHCDREIIDAAKKCNIRLIEAGFGVSGAAREPGLFSISFACLNEDTVFEDIQKFSQLINNEDKTAVNEWSGEQMSIVGAPSAELSYNPLS